MDLQRVRTTIHEIARGICVLIGVSFPLIALVQFIQTAGASEASLTRPVIGLSVGALAILISILFFQISFRTLLTIMF